MRIYLGDLELPVAPERFDASAESGREIAELEAQAQESLATSESEAAFQQKEFERQSLDLDLANGVITADEYKAALLALDEKYDSTIDKNAELNEHITVGLFMMQPPRKTFSGCGECHGRRACCSACGGLFVLPSGRGRRRV